MDVKRDLTDDFYAFVSCPRSEFVYILMKTFFFSVDWKKIVMQRFFVFFSFSLVLKVMQVVLLGVLV